MPNSTSDIKVMQEFARRFSRLAKENDPDLSNQALGKQFGVSSTTIFKWKNAQAMPSMPHACLIALRYRISVDWLLTGRTTPTGAEDHYKELSVIIDSLSPENFDRVLEAARAFQALEKQKG
jgi:transcriptional regulator with XRE-family HTH domain